MVVRQSGDAVGSSNNTRSKRRRGRRRKLRVNPMTSVFLFGSLIAFVVIAGIAQSVTIAEIQYQLDGLRRELDYALQVNQHLHLQVVRMQSLDRIESVAREKLGMVEPSDVNTIVLAPQSESGGIASASGKGDDAVGKPNRYVAAALRILGRIVPALEQVEAGKLQGSSGP